MLSLDLIIVLAFFLIIFIIGIIDRKKLTIEDYWVNSRRTGTFALIATITSSFIGAGSILGGAGFTYQGAGFAALAVAASFALYMLIFSKFFAPKIKEFGDKHKAYSLPDFLEFRYSKKVRVVSALVILVSWSIFLAMQMLAIGIFVNVLTGINPIIATIIGGLIVVLYTTIGGLRADIRTDVFQFIVMLVLIFIFLPIIILKAGGLAPILALPKSFLFGTQFAPPYFWLFAILFLGAASGPITGPDYWQRTYSGNTKKTVVWATAISAVLIFLFYIMAILFGIYGKILFPNIDPNNVVSQLLKLSIPPGIFGIILAGFFAAIMSSADTVILITSLTIVHDIYQKTKDKNFSPQNLLRISRYVTFILGSLSLLIALIVSNIVHLTIQAISFYTVLLPAIVFGFYWKKATSKAALWSIILGFLTTLAFMFIDPIQAFIPGLIVSFLTFFLVNYLTTKRIKTTTLNPT